MQRPYTQIILHQEGGAHALELLRDRFGPKQELVEDSLGVRLCGTPGQHLKTPYNERGTYMWCWVSL